MDDYPEFFETDAAMMCMGGDATERLNWLREASGGLTAPMIFDAARDNNLPETVHVIGAPGRVLSDLMEGDFVVSRVFGEGPIGAVRVVDLNDPNEVWPNERLAADTAVLRLESCGCSTCRTRGQSARP